MRQVLTLSIFFALTLSLSGCGDPEPPPEPPPDPDERVETRDGPELTEPADPPPVRDFPPEHVVEPEVRTPAERDQLLADEDEGLLWWDDDDLAEKLGLEPEQRASLLEAREALHEARLEGREQLEAQRELEAELEGDAERLAELRERSGLIHQELEDAEMRWQEDVRTTLRRDQLRQLEELLEVP